MHHSDHELPEKLILAKQADLLRAFYKLVGLLTIVALLLIAFLPGFATSEDVLEPFVRNTVVLGVILGLYYLVEKGLVLASIYGTISSCALIASYTIYMETPGNMQMLALIMLPTCLAGFLPRRPQFWLVYGLNMILMLFTIWMVMTFKSVDLEYRSVVTLGMLLTLLALLIDTLSSSYRDSLQTTFNQLVAIEAAEQKLSKMDEDLDQAVSERIRAEDVSSQLARTERLALEAAGAGKIVINMNTGLVDLSPEFLTRYKIPTPPTNLANLRHCIDEADRTRFEELTTNKAHRSEHMEGDFKTAFDEQVYWMFLLEAGQPDGEGDIRQGIVVDVSARVLEQQRISARDSKIQESQRLESLGMLAGAIAHDFNNLLHVIMLNADLAKQSLAADTKAATSIDRVMTTVERAAALCSELLAYSGRGQFSIEPFSVEQLIWEMQSLLELSIPKSVGISINAEHSDLNTQGDRTQISQVFMNLISNAGEAIDANDAGTEPGKIAIRMGRLLVDEGFFLEREFIETVTAGEYVFVSIQDNGGGMDRATMQRMFDPFFTTKETGHGLGLSAVLGIIRGHKGTIEVDSTSGHGTRVTVLLPVSEDMPELLAHAEDESPGKQGVGMILFADDEPEIRSLARTVLEDIGYTLLEAENGRQAVDLFKEHHASIDLVILDLLMPGKAGLEAYEDITAIDQSVQVVFSSGYNENEALDQLPPEASSGFIKKPYLARELRIFVQELIDRED